MNEDQRNDRYAQMFRLIDCRWVTAYAQGYHHGRAEGVEKDMPEDEDCAFWYRLGYEQGVTDFIYLDEKETEE